jgi:replicative DNA helicase
MIRKDLVKDLSDRLREVLKSDLSDSLFVKDKVTEFAKNKSMERAILESVDDVAKGNYAKIKQRIDKAMMVGAQESDTLNYFERIEIRTQERKARIAGVIKRDGITTGYEEIDKHLYHHGWGRKELSCIMGAAKAGKSMSLGDFGIKASLAGHNVLYMSCEVAGKIIEERVDANISEIMMKKLDENAFAVEAAVKKAQSGAGLFLVEEYASGTLRPSQVRRALERLRSQGIIIDLLIVDYADIMMPEYRSSEHIDNQRSIFIDLRGIMHDYNCAGLTATQSNREGAKKMTASATDVAEDYNKARTVDLLLSINASEAEKAAGECRIFWALARNGESEFTIRVKQDRSSMRFITKIIGRE